MDDNYTELFDTYLEKLNELLASTLGAAADACNSLNLDELINAADSKDRFNSLQDCLRLCQDLSIPDPQRVLALQVRSFQKQTELWRSTSLWLMGQLNDSPTEVIREKNSDRRFADSAWHQHPLFSHLRQSYLLHCELLEELFDCFACHDDRQQQKLKLLVRQFANAASPTNFLLTNPEALQKFTHTQGGSLLQGLKNLQRDLEQSPDGLLNIQQSREGAFELGENLACSPGGVIFENPIMQVLHYDNKAESVYQRPLLLIPAMINKAYIWDLQPDNSLVKALVDEGHSVYLIAWTNPRSKEQNFSLSDYVAQGVLEALDVVREHSGEKTLNAAGWCLGGTLLAITQALLRKRRQRRIHSCTFLTTPLDFSRLGDLSLSADEEQLAPLLEHSRQRGYVDGRSLNAVFNLMRENDLIWPYAIKNYLKGEEPEANPLLFWNSDSANLSDSMATTTIRDLLGENTLLKGQLEIEGDTIDLQSIDCPSYWVGCERDHLVSWQACWQSSRAVGGKSRFILTGAGHIAGILNSPAQHKYGWRSTTKSVASPEAWLANSREQRHSWWLDWHRWLKRRAGKAIPSQQRRGPYLESAPGSYVRVKSGH